MPVFNVSISEDTPTNSNITQITAMDDDSDELGRIYYSIANIQHPGVTNGTFTIGGRSGIIYTYGVFDRELFDGPYIITVRLIVKSIVVSHALTNDADQCS